MWYLLMGMDWIRYMFPPFFIAGIFVAAYLFELTSGFDFRLAVRRISALLIHREFNFVNLQSLVFLIALSITFGTAIVNARVGLGLREYDPKLASAYLTSHIPTDARIETFESELFFLAPDQTYHFPSDMVSMLLQRKTTIEANLPVDYDPLETNPDYIVIGPMGHLWSLYNEVVTNKKLPMVADVGNYQVYATKVSTVDNR
jgi:hypothetical protein